MRLGSVLILFMFLAFNQVCYGENFSKPLTVERPNVLLILTDDQGFGDMASHGNTILKTPTLDRLAKEGARFDRFFVSPVCAPTRSALLTGRYHPRTGVHGVTRGHETMRASEITIAELLKSSGYATGAFGKWHNGAHFPHHPNGQGFDEFFGFCAGHWNNYFDAPLQHNTNEAKKTKGFLADVLTNKAIEWIDSQTGQYQTKKSQAKKKTPWFAYVPYNTPHTPWQVPETFWKKYQNKGLESHQACAYAMVENIDWNIGRLIEKLKQTKQLDNTIIIFLSDNGANADRFNAGMRGRKGSAHEGGTRVPLLIRYPKMIPQGTTIKPITAHIDLFPTIAEMTGTPLVHTTSSNAKPLDGKSFVPLFAKKANQKTSDWEDRVLFTEWGQANGKPKRAAVRTERWRAVLEKRKTKKRNKQTGWMLFDMQADPSQKKDLAKKHPEVLQKLKQKFDIWFQDVTKERFDPIPIQIGHPQQPTVILSAHEATLYGVSHDGVSNEGAGISYSRKQGFANDWITNWNSAEAYPSWQVQIVEAGEYEVSIDYALAKENFGAMLEVQIGKESIRGAIDIPHTKKQISSPDRVPRKHEVYEQTWATRHLGTITLKPDSNQNKTELKLKTIALPGMQSAEIKAVRLKKVQSIRPDSVEQAIGRIAKIEVRSSIDQTLQPSRLFVPLKTGKLPMLVSLHTWSGNYTQKDIAGMKHAKEHNWIYLRPNFRGKNSTPQACGSALARQDILDAMQYVITNYDVDTSRIYLLGGSGGGHMTLLMAGYHPEKFSAVSAWCPITNVAEWHQFSLTRQTPARKNSAGYAKMIESVFQGIPETSPQMQFENRSRSPVFHLQNTKDLPIQIAAGIHDGHTGSVPISHTLNAFNMLLQSERQPMMAKETIQRWVEKGKPGTKLRALKLGTLQEERPFPCDIYWHQKCNKNRSEVTLFEGGHTILTAVACNYLSSHQRATIWEKSSIPFAKPALTDQDIKRLKRIIFKEQQNLAPNNAPQKHPAEKPTNTISQ